MYDDKTRLFLDGNLNLLIFLFSINFESRNQFVTINIILESCPFGKRRPVQSFNFIKAWKFHQMKK